MWYILVVLLPQLVSLEYLVEDELELVALVDLDGQVLELAAPSGVLRRREDRVNCDSTQIRKEIEPNIIKYTKLN